MEYELVQEWETMTAALGRGPWTAVVSDWSMPRFSALKALECLRAKGDDLPFIVVSGTVGEDVAVEAIRAGAHDFMSKGSLARLAPAMRGEIKELDGRRRPSKG